MTIRPRTNLALLPSPNVADPPPFAKMSWDVFEAMCCSLLAFEPDITIAELFRVAGQRQLGIDVIGRSRSGKATAISCKCYEKVTPKKIEEWFEDFIKNWENQWEKARIEKFILAVAADVNDQRFETTILCIESRCSNFGIAFEPWSPRMLQEKIRVHAGLVGHFLGREWIPRICGVAENSVADPDALLNQRFAHAQACEFEQAVRCAGEAAQLAREMKSGAILRRSLTALVRDLGELLVSHRPDDSPAEEMRRRISDCLNELESTDISEFNLNLEKAAFARLDGRSQDALTFAKLAEGNASTPSEASDALVIQLQAHWQLQDHASGFLLGSKIVKLLEQSLDHDARLALQSAWLRTLIKCDRVDNADVDEFVKTIRRAVSDSKLPVARILCHVDHVFPEFRRQEDLPKVKLLLNVALEIIENLQDPPRKTSIFIQRAEVEAALGLESDARASVRHAANEIEKLSGRADLTKWANAKAMFLATLARIESRLAHLKAEPNTTGQIERLQATLNRFIEAREFVTTNRVNLTGTVDLFIADINLRTGMAAASLGLHANAVKSFCLAQAVDVAAYPESDDLVVEAISREADSELLGGNPQAARESLKRALSFANLKTSVKDELEQKIRFLDKSVKPVIDWLDSDAAQNIQHSVVSKENGLRITVAEQLRPLIEWFDEFPRAPNEQGAYSGLIDVWGRGGFSRIVAAVRADPLSSISVDATSVDQVKMWARVFCPIYDTVIINWKGPIQSCMAVVPLPTNLGSAGTFGGQGYTWTSSVLRDKPNWAITCGWSNLLPEDVAIFIAEEALALVRSGRLVVLPAPLIGCTQNAVGWTDNLFVDVLLGGVVKSAGMRSRGDQMPGTHEASRLLDLGGINIPFMNNVSMNELSAVLDHTDDLQKPLKRLFRETIGSPHLRHERWDRLGTTMQDIREAFRELNEHWHRVSKVNILEQERRVSYFPGAFSALKRQEVLVGHDPMTDLLQSISGTRNNLGPWIPFWRLRDVGGQIEWSGSLNNCSSPPNEASQSQGFNNPVTQGWIYPGEGSPGFREVVRGPVVGS